MNQYLRGSTVDDKEAHEELRRLLVESGVGPKGLDDLSRSLGFSELSEGVRRCWALDPVGWLMSADRRAATVTRRLKRIMNSLLGAHIKDAVFEVFRNTAAMLYRIGKFEKWFKNKTTTLFSRVMKQVIPPALTVSEHKIHRVPGIFLTGGGYVYLNALITKGDKQARERAWTINNLKKIVPCIDEAFMYECYQKHAVALSRTQSKFEEVPAVRRLVENHIRTLSKSVGAQVESIPFRIPSSSSHIDGEVTRFGRGALGRLRAEMYERYRALPTTHEWETECIMDTGPDSFFEFLGSCPSYASTSRAYGEEDEACVSTLARNPCRVICLPEPCKGRIITCGPSKAYHWARMFQKPLHTAMRQMPVFELIGRPCGEDVIERLRESSIGLEGLYDYHLSGDYSSATDLIDPALTRICVEALSESFDEEYASLFTRVLLDHDLVYPEKIKIGNKQKTKIRDGDIPLDIGTVQQSWGQLMGSPLSFIVLCIINAATCRASYDIAEVLETERMWCDVGTQEFLEGLRSSNEWTPGVQRVMMLAEDNDYVDWSQSQPFAVNGDDVAGFSNPDHYKIWQMAIEQGSFEFSIGKNFLSKKFITVNTEMYVPVNTVTGVEYRYVPYVNGDLLFPELIRGGTIDAIIGSNRVPDIGTRSMDLTRGWGLAEKDELISFLIAEFHDILKVVPGEIPWFVHQNEGGLGILQTRQHSLSVGQKKLVHYFRNFAEEEDNVTSLFDELRDDNVSYVKAKGEAVQITGLRSVLAGAHDGGTASLLGLVVGQGARDESQATANKFAARGKSFRIRVNRIWAKAQRRVTRKEVVTLQTGNWTPQRLWVTKTFTTTRCNWGRKLHVRRTGPLLEALSSRVRVCELELEEE